MSSYQWSIGCEPPLEPPAEADPDAPGGCDCPWKGRSECKACRAGV